MSFNEWKFKKLSEVLDFFNGKKRPNSEGIIPVYGGNGILDYCNDSNSNGESIIIGRVGAYCGNVNYETKKCWISDNAILAKVKDNISSQFMYYKLVNMNLYNLRIGSSQPLLTQNILKNLETNIPSFEEQINIVNILASLDEKIENNNKINKKLEEMAQAIFKQWFVDFEFPNENGEPYKSSGGKMIESELIRMIPEGWKVGILGEIIEISSGKRPNKKFTEPSEGFLIPLAGASSIMGYVEEYNYNEPILVIGRVGTHGIIQRFNSKVWASDNTLVIKSKHYEYTNQILKNIDYTSLNRGSTQPLITQTDIKNQKIVIPSDKMLLRFEKLLDSLYKVIDNNLLENNNLEKLRNNLLPKLISGEIRVPLNN